MHTVSASMPNPSIERTSFGRLRHPQAASQVKRWISHLMYALRVMVAALAAALVGCGEPRPAVVVNLDISSSGVYAISGASLTIEELKDKLRAIQASGTAPTLHINASSEAAFESVGRAVKGAGDVGAAVAFVTSPPPKQ